MSIKRVNIHPSILNCSDKPYNSVIPCIYPEENNEIKIKGSYDLRLRSDHKSFKLSSFRNNVRLLTGLGMNNVIWIELDNIINDWLVAKENIVTLLKRIIPLNNLVQIGFSSSAFLLPAFEEGHFSHEFALGILNQLNYRNKPWLSIPFSYHHSFLFLANNFYCNEKAYTPFRAFKKAGYNIQIEIHKHIHDIDNKLITEAMNSSDKNECYFSFIALFKEIDAIYFGEKTEKVFFYYMENRGRK